MVGVWVKNTASLVAYDKLKTDTYDINNINNLNIVILSSTLAQLRDHDDEVSQSSTLTSPLCW